MTPESRHLNEKKKSAKEQEQAFTNEITGKLNKM